jgi:hypothetical protein
LGSIPRAAAVEWVSAARTAPGGVRFHPDPIG